MPKSFYAVGTSFQTALVARKLKQKGTAVGAQQRTLRALLPHLAATEQGREAGVAAEMDYARFRARVPLRSYEQLAPAIERMIRGDAGVLWPGRCSLYVQSAGTTGTQPKRLPVTEPMLAHFRRAGRAALLSYTARVGHAGVMRGRHLFLGGSTELTPLTAGEGASSFLGTLPGILEINLPRWAEKHLYEPGTMIARLAESPEKTAAIATRTRPLDITLLAGEPDALLGFASAFCDAGVPNLQTVWPNLECLIHGGSILGPQSDELRHAAGPTVNLHEIYAAAEGLFAAQDGETSAGLRLLADCGLFFEFLPLTEFDESLPAGLGARAVPLADVRSGENYVLVLTTPSGLCRYVTGDIVRFTSTTPPRLVCAGRTQLQMNAFGERAVEKDLGDALIAVCQRHGWSIIRFHVAPLFAASRTGAHRGGHEWWVELRPGTIETPTGPILAAEVDRELVSRHEGYAAKRRSGTLDAPVVRLVMPGFFAHWLRHHAAGLNQPKLPRCRNDRSIADSLTALACFKPD